MHTGLRQRWSDPLVCQDRPCESLSPIRPSTETLTYAVLDDQSTDVFITDSLLNELRIHGCEVNLQVNTIVGTNTIRTKRISGICIQDVNNEHSH